MHKLITSTIEVASVLATERVRGSLAKSRLGLGQKHGRLPMIKSAVTGLVLSAILASGAHAQNAPMDMSWAIRSQLRNQQIGDATARYWGMQYYNYMQRLRQLGYTGPSLPTGITPESLQRSIAAANDATQRYIRSGQINSERRSFAVQDWDMRAIRGCSWGVNNWGQWGYICP